MLQKWLRREPKPAPPSDEATLAELLIDPLFKQRIREVAVHNRRGFEGGYAAYRYGAGFVLSKAILPEPDWWAFTHWSKNRSPRTSFPGFMLYNQFAPPIRPRDAEEEWLHRQDPNRSPKPRKDVFFYLHSHPCNIVTPSKSDVKSWEWVEAASPGVVYSILGNEGVHARALMFRRQAVAPGSGFDSSVLNLRQRLADEFGRFTTGEFIERAKTVGVKAVVGTYNVDLNRLYPSAKSLAEELAE